MDWRHYQWTNQADATGDDTRQAHFMIHVTFCYAWQRISDNETFTILALAPPPQSFPNNSSMSCHLLGRYFKHNNNKGISPIHWILRESVVVQIPIKLIKHILWSLYTGRTRSPRYGSTLWAHHVYSLSHWQFWHDVVHIYVVSKWNLLL